MSSVEQTSTKGISLKFPLMASWVPSVKTDKSSLVKTPLPTITDHVQVQNTANPTIYTVPVSNIALNQQQTEITKIAHELLSATPPLQETLDKVMSRMTHMKNSFSQMQGNVPVPNFQYFQLPNLSSNLVVTQQNRPFKTLFILN